MVAPTRHAGSSFLSLGNECRPAKGTEPGTAFRTVETKGLEWPTGHFMLWQRPHFAALDPPKTLGFGVFVAAPETFRTDRNAWWAREDSNLQPDRYERSALTIELRARNRADGTNWAAAKQ